jgi:hypothetical protein
MMLLKFVLVFASLHGILASPIPTTNSVISTERHNGAVPEWYVKGGESLSKRSNEKEITLQDGNKCDILASAGSGTEGWRPEDYGNLFDQAGRSLTSSILLNNRNTVSQLIQFRDHNGRSHQVDCEVSTTGAASVSVSGAYQNVNQALTAAEGLADGGWNGFVGTSRSTMRIFFGNVVAISIAINVLN